MAIPEYIAYLRQHVGHKPLWLSGICAIVFNNERDILLIQRADNHQWTPITGITEPGEHPAITATREVLEEANVTVTIDYLAAVDVTPPIIHANKDRAQYLNLTFRCQYVSGNPQPDGDETLAAQWFSATDLPPLSQRHQEHITRCLRDQRETDLMY